MVEKITRQEIDEIKRRHVLENLLHTPTEAAAILAVSVRQVYTLVEEGKLTPASETLKTTGRATKGLRITAMSLEKYRISITVTALEQGGVIEKERFPK